MCYVYACVCVVSGQVPIVRVLVLRLQSVQINRQETLAVHLLETGWMCSLFDSIKRVCQTESWKVLILIVLVNIWAVERMLIIAMCLKMPQISLPVTGHFLLWCCSLIENDLLDPTCHLHNLKIIYDPVRGLKWLLWYLYALLVSL